jgi:acyl-CoA ligase (AMP-forming) (exosortase A-associated)
MSQLLHDLLTLAAQHTPEATALIHRQHDTSYAALHALVERVASSLVAAGLGRQERVGVLLPKCVEAVAGMFGAARAGGVFVPINPLLKPAQITYILNDCNVRVLITNVARATELEPHLAQCPDLRVIVCTDGAAGCGDWRGSSLDWNALLASAGGGTTHRVIDMDMTSILYTSGSTGRPKGVVLSHRNMVTGAHSVAQYLENRPEDRLLAVLPFSFDYGFSQLSTAFVAGASAVLMDYLLPRDVLAAVAANRVTGLAGVPPLWIQLGDLDWPAAARESLRYITNSGGAMPGATLGKLRALLPRTRAFLMYGLTEAFRSTYLPPEEVDQRPDSIGKAIPNAEILVVRPDGTLCDADEPGELVHRGSLVAMGYWNDPAKTAERFKPAPARAAELVLPEMAVWSGDAVRRDRDGYLYFIGRRDEMIKTSGYRVSPTEIEEVVYATGLVIDAVALGVPHPLLGQAIVVVAAARTAATSDDQQLLDECRRQLPAYMVPAHIEWRDSLPRNPNGKFDRPRLASELSDLFSETSA